MNVSIARAADALLAGGVVTCPTEGVFGLSCMPDDADAIARLLTIKQRDPAKGLILVASAAEQLEPWMATTSADIPPPNDQQAITWIVPAAASVSSLVRGEHQTIAVRLTTHPVMAALCDAVDSALVSTSANRSGEPVVRNTYVLQRKFAASVDYIVPGDCGGATGPSEIRVLETGEILRAAE